MAKYAQELFNLQHNTDCTIIEQLARVRGAGHPHISSGGDTTRISETGRPKFAQSWRKLIFFINFKLTSVSQEVFRQKLTNFRQPPQ
jgi:hypothetical protein